MQHNSGSAVQYWQSIQFQILVNLPKWYVHFFDGDGGRSSHHSDLEKQRLQVVGYDEDSSNQNGKPFTLPTLFPILSVLLLLP